MRSELVKQSRNYRRLVYRLCLLLHVDYNLFINRGRNRIRNDDVYRIWNKIRTTDRTGHVTLQPSVNTLRMKHVITLRNQPNRFFILVLVETHGALKSPFTDLEAFDGGVYERRKRLNDRRIEAA
ncbi:hypothetical protein HanIR_Chr07g0312301 [Helianthus annuus]|nr:hypothetical protein HanIR_Chr07g0312301 [Helianthus annuus]